MEWSTLRAEEMKATGHPAKYTGRSKRTIERRAQQMRNGLKENGTTIDHFFPRKVSSLPQV